MSVILATGGYDHKIRFWEAPSGLCSRTLPFRGSQINHLEVTPDKQFLAAGGNPLIRLYDVEHNNGASGDGGGSSSNGGGGNGDNGGGNNNTSSESSSSQQQQQQQSVNPVLTCEGHRSNVTSLGFQPNGRWMYSGSEDGTVKIWDLRSNTFSRSFDARGAVNSVCLHPNQVEIISGDSNGNVKIWDLGSSRCINDVCPTINSPLGHRNPIQSVTISEDCHVLCAISNSSDVFIWKPHSSPSSSTTTTHHSSSSLLHPISKFRSHPLGHYALRAKISPDGRHLVTTSSDRTARLWDTERWECVGTLKQHRGWVWDAVFSADSSYLVTACSDHCARLWNLRSGEVVRQYSGHVGAVTCVALNDSST